MTALDAQFESDVAIDDCIRFAQLSGDWNPLHTDPQHAAGSVYGRQVLHGAYSAGLISRLAGMHLPGKDCLLYGMRLRFVSPILPPTRLLVRGRVVAGSAKAGRVEATVSDATTGALYVDASYEFGHHRAVSASAGSNAPSATTNDKAVVLVTGASGGLGGAVVRRLGARAQAIARSPESNRLELHTFTGDASPLGDRQIAGIVHCAWPAPDNRRLIDVDDPAQAIAHNVAGPLQDIQVLATLLATRGRQNAPLVLIGSTFSKAGRHYFRMPLYSIAKSTIPTIVEILALELASKTKRCFGVVFDVLDGGMNKGIAESARLANADRSPWGVLPTPDEAAEQIVWLLENQSRLLSGATLTLSSGSVP